MTPKRVYSKCSPAKILAFLQAQTEPLSVIEIAAAMNIQKRRVFDALGPLAREGDVIRTGKRNQYRYAVPKDGRANEGDEEE